MKKLIIIFLIILAVFLCSCKQNSIVNTTVNSKEKATSSTSVAPVYSETLVFSETTGIASGISAVESNLVCRWSDVEMLLADIEYTEYNVEGMKEINGLVGFRTYEILGIIFSARIENYGQNDFANIVLAIITSDKYVLNNGIHCGMLMDEAEEIINKYDTQYEIINLLVEDTKLEMLRQEQYPLGMFDGCTTAIVVPYTRSTDSIGQVLCIYSKTGETVDYITSNLYGAA